MMKYSVYLPILLMSLSSPLVKAAEPMLQANVRGQQVEGLPLFYTPSRMQLLLRDGSLLDFKKSEARNVRESADTFRGYSASEMRRRLAEQFGREFDVTGIGHYLVVHPRGEKNRWAQRLEDLYRDFVHYFSVRDFALSQPKYPLIAVVWKHRAEFQSHAAKTGARIGTSVLGYYSQSTNRVHLYDATGGTEGANSWQQNADTIIHEVTHQTAFNTGVHTRFADTPRWVAEGLGTLFEARGIYASRAYPNRSDRMNRGRFEAYRYYLGELEPGFLKLLIESEAGFRREPGTAYAQAWALTFYLVETQPSRYSQYLARVADRKPGLLSSRSERLADFVEVFGDDFPMLEARFQRFMAELR